MSIERLLREASFEDIAFVISRISIVPTELNQVFVCAIEEQDWPLVGRCVSAIQLVPNTIYSDALCRLLTDHRAEFHPEEVIEAIGEIFELAEARDSYVFLIDCLAPLVREIRDGDPAQHINRKCIDILDFVVRKRGGASRRAAELLEEATGGNAEFAAEAARESLILLRREGFLP